MSETTNLEEELIHYRTKLFPYAYNIIGATEPARDLVEEVIVPFFTHDHSHVENTAGYLTRSVINKSINCKQLLRNQMEHYPGDWLPEPVETPESIYREADKQQVLNYSLLVLMEKLNPQERAVYILKHAFDFKHPDIADVLEIKEDHSRQLYKRANDKVKTMKGGRRSLNNSDRLLLSELTNAMAEADLSAIKRLLTDTIQAVSDGGPDYSAARKPLKGLDHVAKLLRAIGTKYMLEGTKIRFTSINHQPAIVYMADKQIYRSMILKTRNGKVSEIYTLLNREKLKFL
ncbi:sigma factor-like helix-turn-helix DNA-binding protein [Ekhidna sp.]|uniref:sigma factor-like helix-turn-helix DNA-binding protein n=1 Tax=Ekhidna sp. TaxID=2608089 RepID=UPI003B59BA5D